jgi:hypothetical protein
MRAKRLRKRDVSTQPSDESASSSRLSQHTSRSSPRPRHRPRSRATASRSSSQRATASSLLVRVEGVEDQARQPPQAPERRRGRESENLEVRRREAPQLRRAVGQRVEHAGLHVCPFFHA